MSYGHHGETNTWQKLNMAKPGAGKFIGLYNSFSYFGKICSYPRLYPGSYPIVSRLVDQQ